VYGLVRAFGKESKDWCNNVLTAHPVDAMVGDTMRTIIYLVPEGFELRKNAEKKLEIVKIEGESAPEPQPEEEITPDDIPF
jgi:hypothetical protein